nr:MULTISPECIES: AAC(3) family N-acetyltransferase [unclassified Streptomyces]
MRLDSSPFAAVGAAYEATGAVRSGRVGHAHCRLFDLADAVAFALVLPCRRPRQGRTRGPIPKSQG